VTGDYPEQEYTGSVIGRAVLAGFAFFVAIMAGMYWFFTTSTYQFCSSAIGALNSRCAVEAFTHNASGWVTLMAIAAGRSSRAAVLARGSATLCLAPVPSSRAGFLAGVARKPQPASPGWLP
jgi:hypothetical protein